MCTDDKTNVQPSPEQMQAPQGFGEAPEGVPENHEENMYASPEAASGYAVGAQMAQAPEGYMYQQPQMQMPPQQPQMMQAPQMPQAPEGYMYQQPQMQMPPQQPQMMQAPQMPQAPEGYMYQQPQMQMPPQQPQMQMPPQMPYMGQPQMMGMPMPPQFMPQPDMSGGKSGCSHDHKDEDPFGGMFGMFGEMVDNNPNLSALNKAVGATNSDFLKGALLGAGLTLLLTSDGVKDMLSGLLAGTMNMFGNEEDTGEEDE